MDCFGVIGLALIAMHFRHGNTFAYSNLQCFKMMTRWVVESLFCVCVRFQHFQSRKWKKWISCRCRSSCATSQKKLSAGTTYPENGIYCICLWRLPANSGILQRLHFSITFILHPTHVWSTSHSQWFYYTVPRPDNNPIFWEVRSLTSVRD